MKQIVRLTENELQRVLRESVKKAFKQKNVVINEHVDWEREIALAHKTLMKMSPLLSDLGHRLDGTKFYKQFQRMRDAIVELNDDLIKHIRRKR